MALTTSSQSQQRVAQPVHPILDASGAPEIGQTETQDAMDVITTKGYFGNTPADNEGS